MSFGILGEIACIGDGEAAPMPDVADGMLRGGIWMDGGEKDGLRSVESSDACIALLLLNPVASDPLDALACSANAKLEVDEDGEGWLGKDGAPVREDWIGSLPEPPRGVCCCCPDGNDGYPIAGGDSDGEERNGEVIARL
jgi:hypothetical protein